MSINRSLHRIAKEGVVQTLEAKDKEIERLHSIIKEAREYTKKHFMSIDGEICIDFGDHTCEINDNFLDKLLEILNKGDK